MRADQDTTVHAESLADLFTRYLTGQAARLAEGGLGLQLGGELELHDAGPVQAVDPRLAWDEAVAALKVADPKAGLPGPASVPDWRGLVAAQEPALDLAFATGNFPQMVRNLTLLLQGSPSDVPQSRPFANGVLGGWAEESARKSAAHALLAAGVLRLARDFDGSARLLDGAVPAGWEAARANERAALLWHSGKRDAAAALWQEGDGTHVPTLFNRGMAALFLGRAVAAQAPLKAAVAALPDTGSWHHLGRLYLTLAEMRG